MPTLLIFGLGYSGTAVAKAARAAGIAVVGTTRRIDQDRRDIQMVAFDAADDALAQATYVLATAAPDDQGSDPVLGRWGTAIVAAPNLRWVGYLSSTGVYGDHAGGWVDEATPPRPSSARGQRRLDAECEWGALADRLPVDIFRLAGIYGPGRSVLDDVRDGKARRIVKPDHGFGRIHRDDIAAAVLAAMQQERPRGPRILNLADDEPAASADVIAEAARLLGLPAPLEIPYEQARATMSPMARSFWADNRRVAGRDTQAALGLRWRYPTYREGLRAILAEQGSDGPA